MNAAEKRAEADRLEAKATTLRGEARELDLAALRAKPLLDRLVFAAYSRCVCGAGIAYDSSVAQPYGPTAKWECSAILRLDELSPEEQAATKAATHTGALPFEWYDIKSERQPSAGGATTRPPSEG